MAKRHGGNVRSQRKGGRLTGVRRQGDLSGFDGLCREILSTQGRDVLRGGDPLEAELWASYLKRFAK
jgi:hypothetical protein